MSMGRRVAGVLALLFGLVGVAACLAGAAGIAIAASRAQRLNATVFAQLDEWTMQIDGRVEQARVAAETTHGVTEELAETLRSAAAEAIESRVESQPRVEELERRLSGAMSEATGMLEASAAGAELFERFVRVWGEYAAARPQAAERSAELLAAIQGSQQAIEQATGMLADLQSRLDSVRGGEGTDEDSQRILKLAGGILMRLEVVQQQLRAFRERLQAMRDALDELRATVQGRIRLTAMLSGLVLFWFGLGQWFLAAAGWRWLRGS
jgi:chromosome segregation ATPase